MNDPVLEARSVSKVYPGGVQALERVDLDVRDGETVVLVGESGCGKTTLLRAFNRLVEPTSGEIRIRGRPARDLDPIALRRATGYVQQESGLLPHWTIGRNVELVPTLLGWPMRDKRERADELLRLTGLDPAALRRRYPRELSGGQRQRVAFARALAADPEVVLLDEPFGALDALTRLELQDQFLELKTRLGKTMLMVTHDLNEAFRLADRVAVMYRARLLRLATPAELREHPGDAYTERLLARTGTGPQ